MVIWVIGSDKISPSQCTHVLHLLPAHSNWYLSIFFTGLLWSAHYTSRRKQVDFHRHSHWLWIHTGKQIWSWRIFRTYLVILMAVFLLNSRWLPSFSPVVWCLVFGKTSKSIPGMMKRMMNNVEPWQPLLLHLSCPPPFSRFSALRSRGLKPRPCVGLSQLCVSELLFIWVYILEMRRSSHHGMIAAS